ncbi:helix-turn-helix domain-containing protein [Microbacterium oleivorans]|uniref:helix-turn-helix domain-containing protein n=1 Tax=Microbacterium oleivorans TaxID=273677 RepID=UPI00203EFCCC|nr:helix-turn-helix domain-containing protein [Microbacterium oleivorans]MCM3696207.1 helix-turn-helix domain-containing protein [Microbacterium oleivorans]
MTVIEEHFRSADLGEAEEYIRRSYGNVQLDADDLVFEESSTGDERFGLRRLNVEGGYSASCDLEAVIVVQSDDGYEWEVGGVRGTAQSPVLFQPGTLDCRLQDARVQVVALPVDVLTDVARTVYNDDTLTLSFDGASALSPALSMAWRSTTAMAFDAEPLFGNDLVRASVFRSLAVSTLETFAAVDETRARRETVEQQQTAYRRAVAFLEDHASLPITIDDAAAAAGVGAAALARAFRTHSLAGRTPEEHLSAVRLDAAHADLVRAPLGGSVTVAEIAARWGFAEAAFVRLHRRAYGVPPGELLGL